MDLHDSRWLFLAFASFFVLESTLKMKGHSTFAVLISQMEGEFKAEGLETKLLEKMLDSLELFLCAEIMASKFSALNFFLHRNIIATLKFTRLMK